MLGELTQNQENNQTDNIFDLTSLKPVIEYAFAKHLAQPYTDKDSSIDLFLSTAQGRIERPNHGLAHTIRKLFYVALYATALKESSHLPNIFQNIDTQTIRKLQAVMIFSVTGRECDIEPPGKYNEYKKASAQNFRQYFLPDGKGLFADAEEIKAYSIIVQLLANSPRSAPMPPPVLTNKIFTEFLTMCHALDERRCWNIVKYNNMLKPIKYLIGEEKYQELKNFVLCALKATGNKILFEPYQEPLFYSCSTDVDFCISQLNAIPKIADKIEKNQEPTNSSPSRFLR